MDKEKLLLGVSTNLDTIKAHINRLKRPGYKIHSLDVDMLKSKAYELYEQILTLEDYVNSGNTKPAIQEKKEDIAIKPEKIVKEEKPVGKEEVNEEKPSLEEKLVSSVDKESDKEKITPVLDIEEPKPVIIDNSSEDDFEDVKIEDIEEKDPVTEEKVIVEDKSVNKTDVVEKPDEKVEKISKKESATTYDLFTGSTERPVAEKLTKREETSIADKMQKAQINNIREAIGINDKFLFINELFNGDMSRYNRILDDINSMVSKNGVETFLLELKIQSQWTDENEAFIRFKEIIERKFS